MNSKILSYYMKSQFLGRDFSSIHHREKNYFAGFSSFFLIRRTFNVSTISIMKGRNFLQKAKVENLQVCCGIIKKS